MLGQLSFWKLPGKNPSLKDKHPHAQPPHTHKMCVKLLKSYTRVNSIIVPSASLFWLRVMWSLEGAGWRVPGNSDYFYSFLLHNFKIKSYLKCILLSQNYKSIWIICFLILWLCDDFRQSLISWNKAKLIALDMVQVNTSLADP